jgi:hypothetical protein
VDGCCGVGWVERLDYCSVGMMFLCGAVSKLGLCVGARKHGLCADQSPSARVVTTIFPHHDQAHP